MNGLDVLIFTGGIGERDLKPEGRYREYEFLRDRVG